MITKREHNGEEIVIMENRRLRAEIAPGVGGRVVSLQGVENGYQYLWRNEGLPLKRLPAGSEYDPNFYGGIDELLPNDTPEEFNGRELLDHGELWTMGLDWKTEGDSVHLSGTLPLCGLHYEKTVELCGDEPELLMRYRLTNTTRSRQEFLWKIHAALNIQEGDEVICPAKTAEPAGEEWSKWKTAQPFDWPVVRGQRADIVPPRNGEMDFLYLYGLKDGYMGWRRPSEDLGLMYRFDKRVFPYCWYFASYGGFFGHYTAVLEPCTAMPFSLREAAAAGRCAALEAGESLETEGRLYAGSARGLEKVMGRPSPWTAG